MKNLQTYQYGQEKLPPGLCIGVTRYPPRGVPAAAYQAKGYFEVRMPLLSPSPDLLSAFLKNKISFASFAARYRSEMKRPEPSQVIRLLAEIARRQRVNIGCFCADPERCHRTLLSRLIAAAASDPWMSDGRPCGG